MIILKILWEANQKKEKCALAHNVPPKLQLQFNISLSQINELLKNLQENWYNLYFWYGRVSQHDRLLLFLGKWEACQRRDGHMDQADGLSCAESCFKLNSHTATFSIGSQSRSLQAIFSI